VVINDDARFITGSHDINSPTYDHIFASIKVGDFAWVATGAIILQGVSIGEGAVIAAGAVVSRDVEAFAVVAGNPARKIAIRKRQELIYKPSCWFAPISAWIGKQC
jgi:maltose O-acetyltransferase